MDDKRNGSYKKKIEDIMYLVGDSELGPKITFFLQLGPKVSEMEQKTLDWVP